MYSMEHLKKQVRRICTVQRFSEKFLTCLWIDLPSSQFSFYKEPLRGELITKYPCASGTDV